MNPREQADLLRKLARPESNKLAATDTSKDSPVIRQTASRSTSTPSMNTEPSSSLGSMQHSHVHTHSDETGVSYQHAHPHNHPVRHSPSDDMDSDIHGHHSAANQAARLARLAKQAAGHSDPLIRHGGEELLKKAVAISPRAAAAAVQKIELAAAAVKAQPRAEPKSEGIAELVTEARWLQAQAETYPDFGVRQAAKERLKAVAAELRKAAGLDDDEIIRKAAEGGQPRQATQPAYGMTQQQVAASLGVDHRTVGRDESPLGQMPKTPKIVQKAPSKPDPRRSVVRKAAALDRRSGGAYVLTPELSKMISASVQKSVGDLVRRIQDLQRSADNPTSRTRL